MKIETLMTPELMRLITKRLHHKHIDIAEMDVSAVLKEALIIEMQAERAMISLFSKCRSE